MSKEIESKSILILNEQSNMNNNDNSDNTILNNKDVVSSNETSFDNINLSKENIQNPSRPSSKYISLSITDFSANTTTRTTTTTTATTTTTTSNSFNNQNRILIRDNSIDDIENSNIQPQIPWSFMKKCYVFGFCFTPLWYVGFFFIFSKKEDVRVWAWLSALNAIFISILISYIAILGHAQNK